MKIKIGDIFLNQPIKNEVMGLPPERFNYYLRIIFGDVSFYYFEQWFPEKNIGGIKLYGNKLCVYHRISLNNFKNSKYIKNVPLTEEEKKIAFIDKPINLLPDLKGYFWTSEKIETKREIIQIFTKENHEHLNSFPKIEMSAFILLPFNSRDGFGKAVKLEADNGSFFTSIELLFKIHNEQSNYIKTNQTFAFKGVSRAGHQKGLPSYSVRKE